MANYEDVRSMPKERAEYQKIHPARFLENDLCGTEG
jgi:hypothetical protein